MLTLSEPLPTSHSRSQGQCSRCLSHCHYSFIHSQGSFCQHLVPIRQVNAHVVRAIAIIMYTFICSILPPLESLPFTIVYGYKANAHAVRAVAIINNIQSRGQCSRCPSHCHSTPVHKHKANAHDVRAIAFIDNIHQGRCSRCPSHRHHHVYIHTANIPSTRVIAIHNCVRL